MPRKQPPKLQLGEVLRAQLSGRLEAAAQAPSINRWKPMPMQEIFLKTEEKHRILIGGNRSGKTAAGCADDVLVLLRRHPHRQHLYADRPLRLRFIGVDFDRGIDQTAVPYFSQYIPPSALINGSWSDSYRPSEHMLTLADGSTCSFMSYEQGPNKFQSVSLDHIHFDEEPPKAIWDESMLRILDTNGTWTLSETPVSQMEWIQDELIDPWEAGEKPNMAVIRLNTLDNIHIAQEAKDEVGANLTEAEKRIRFGGEYLAGALVFPHFKRTAPYVIPHEAFMNVLRADRLRTWKVYRSMDYGLSNATAWAWTAVHPDGSIVTFALLYEADVLIQQWAERVHEMDRAIAYSLGLPELPIEGTFGDPSITHKNNGQTGITNQQAYANLGIPIAVEGLVKARSGDQNVGLDKMRTYQLNRPAYLGASAATGNAGEPWWQLTDTSGEAHERFTEYDTHGVEALAVELKKARKPKQTLTQAQVKNVSEGIRDKDNHAIDAVKYLFMITHDLRPQRVIEEELSPITDEMRDYLHATAPAPATHSDAFHSIVLSDRTGPSGPGSYASFEE